MSGTICVRIGLMLLISIGLLVIAAGAQENNLNSFSSEKSEPKLVLIESDTESVEIGDTIHLTGVIDHSLISGSPSDTVILISAPDGSLADTFVLSSPDRHGEFDYSIPADVGGVWGFEALYNGVNSQIVEVEAFPSDEPGRTTLTLSGWPVYPRVGESVTFKGRLTDATGKGIPNQDIVFEFATSHYGCVAGCKGNDLTEWGIGGVEKTDLSGEYFFALPVEEEGGVTVRVVFAGDQQYRKSESRAIGITATRS